MIARAVGHSYFEAAGGDEAAARFESIYGAGVRIAGWGAQHQLRHSRFDAGEFALNDVESDARFSFDVGALGVLVVETLRRGRLERETRGSSGDLPARRVAVLAEPDQDYRGAADGASYEAVSLPVSLLSRAAGHRRDDAVLRFGTFVPVDEHWANHWASMTEHLRVTLTQNPAVFDEPLVRHAFAHQLAVTVLSAFPNSFVDPRLTSKPSTGTVVANAREYIDAHAHLPIGVGDVAAHCRVSLRSLQYAFEREGDDTPTACLRQARLVRAHHDLLAAARGDGVTVGEIAARWGFYNQGKFAAYYRRLYGQAPSVTLRA